MNRLIHIVLCIVAVATQAWAGPYEDGVTAYEQGRFDSAYALWKPLAEQGHSDAQFNLGVLFEKGLGVAKDYAEAARWYIKAGERGDEEAQYNVAVMYEKGTGLSLDLDKARYWYDKVLANPHADRESVATKRRARERLANLSPPEEIIAYEGGRFVLRRALSGDCVVALQGFVDRDASFKFDDVVKKAITARCNKPLTLLLESPGGTLSDGIELGQEVRYARLRTVARYECASACAIIFLGGDERLLVGSRARIGFHQAAVVGERDRRCARSMDSFEAVKMRKYLRGVVPDDADRIFQLVMNTSCDSIEWIYGQRARELGVATRLESEGIDVFGPKENR